MPVLHDSVSPEFVCCSWLQTARQHLVRQLLRRCFSLVRAISCPVGRSPGMDRLVLMTTGWRFFAERTATVWSASGTRMAGQVQPGMPTTEIEFDGDNQRHSASVPRICCRWRGFWTVWAGTKDSRRRLFRSSAKPSGNGGQNSRPQQERPEMPSVRTGPTNAPKPSAPVRGVPLGRRRAA